MAAIVVESEMKERNGFLLDVIKFKVCGAEISLTEDSKLKIETEIKSKTDRLMGSNTTVKWIIFERGSIEIYVGLVTTVYFSSKIILNYKTFKDSLKELIKDIGSYLDKFFKVKTKIALNERAMDDIGIRYSVMENGGLNEISSTIPMDKGIIRYDSSTEVY